MKALLLASFFFSALAQVQQPQVYVRGAGDKWYSAWELEQIARDYVNERKIRFALEGTKPIVWVNTGGSNVIASVSFASGVASGIVVVDIDRHGKAITNEVGVGRNHVGSPGSVDVGNANSTRTEVSRVWSDPSMSVRQRADAVNRAFTNGTPVSAVVAALGTNYAVCGSSARLWAGAQPEPPNTFWLSYRFGEDEVTIGTSAVFGRDLDPLSGKFTGAGYSLPAKR